MKQEIQLAKVYEDPQAIKRYEILKPLGREILGASDTIMAGTITEEDKNKAKEFLSLGAKETNPEVWASYWEHMLIAPELGRRIGRRVAESLGINPSEIEFLLYLHDIGRLVVPGAYLRNDFIGDRLLAEAGVPKGVSKNLPSVARLMIAAEALDLSDDQRRFQQPLTGQQQQKAEDYFEQLSHEQKIVNFADNLGKRGADGRLFDTEGFIAYLKSQEGRYVNLSSWPSINWAIPRRQDGAVLQAETIQKTAEWLENLGINISEILASMSEYGPRFMVVARHGELYNPRGIVYNRDSEMAKEDIVHLNKTGEEQIRQLGELLKKRGFRCVRIATSPETRAQESTAILNEQLQAPVLIVDDLDDVYAPGPYREQMSLGQLEAIGGDVYDEQRWGKYHHEQPTSVIARMHRAFWDSVNSLKTGETEVLVSHGDPVAWLANTLNSDEVPEPSQLRSLTYPAKGEGLLAIISPDNTIFTYYLINYF